jgi:PHS family inorganic phosphate transporter-like MFS transporter
MMAAVFFMQPVGQLISQLVGLWVLVGYGQRYPGFQTCTDQPTCAVHVDSIWRWVTGAGAIPAVVAIWFRFRIKDPGLYDLDVKDHGDRAIKNTEKIYTDSSTNVTAIEMQTPPLANNGATAADPPLPEQFTWSDIYNYFWMEGNWRSLLGTSLCWFLLDL